MKLVIILQWPCQRQSCPKSLAQRISHDMFVGSHPHPLTLTYEGSGIHTFSATSPPQHLLLATSCYGLQPCSVSDLGALASGQVQAAARSVAVHPVLSSSRSESARFSDVQRI